MCIIIDSCTWSAVFLEADHFHAEFKPVKDWLMNGRGKAVLGGSKYREELARAERYLDWFTELERRGSLVSVPSRAVDKEQRRIENYVDDVAFDDAHLAAIVSVSGCKLICSKDKSAYPFLKRKDIYPKRIDRPRLYSGARNIDLLRDKYMATCCR